MGAAVVAGASGAALGQAFSTTSVISDTDGGELLAGDELQLLVNIWDSDGTYSFKDISYSIDFSTADSDIAIESVQFSSFCLNSTASFTQQPGPTVSVSGLEPFNINNEVFGCYSLITFTLPDDIAAGTYTVDVSDASATAVDGAMAETGFTQALNDASFTVVADTVGPTPVISTPGSDLPDEPFNISIDWGEVVQNFVSGDISVTNGSVTSFDPVVGEAGGTDARRYVVTITPDGPGTLIIDIPTGVADDQVGNSNTDTASATVEILTLATLSMQVLTNPVDPGGSFVVRFTVENDNATAALTGGSFNFFASDFVSGLTMSLASTPAEPCGTGSGASLSNADGYLALSGMNLAANSSCTFDVDTTIPGGTSSGTYVLGLSSWSYSLDGNGISGPATSASLQVSGAEGAGSPLVFTKTFSADQVNPGDEIDLEFHIVPEEGTDLSSAAFTDDLDAVLSGLAVTGDLPTAPCGVGSSLTGTSSLTFTGGNLADGESCTFSVTLTVPEGASAGFYTNTTSDLTGFSDDGGGAAAFTESGASDSFSVNNLVPGVTLSTDTTSPGVGEAFSVTIRFSEAVTGFELADFDVLNAVLSNLAAVTGENAYTFDATASATGALTIQLPAGTVEDADMNINTASNVISLTAVAAEPEIDVTGAGTDITSGATTADLNDGTHFGTVGTSGSTLVKTFVITNSGSGTLTFTGGTPVTLSGTDASEFSVVSQPTTLAPGGTFDLQISYDPTTSATDDATVSIASDDADEDPFTFAIRGIGSTGPEIAVSGNSVNISDNDVTATTTDHTDFGSVDLGSTQTRTFTITNTGDDTLTLGTDAVSLIQTESQFEVTTQPATSLAASATTTFVITYTPTVVGARNATVSIASDDADENPFEFAIQAEGTGGIEANLTGNGIDIVDGDSAPAAADGTDFGTVQVGDTVTQTFVIENTGTTTMTLSPAPIEVSGQSVGSTTVDVFGSSDFTITSQPSTTITAGSTSSFVVSYTPSSTGTVSATTIAFGTDDPDEQRYEFAVTGFATTPEIAVSGEGNDISDGDSTPVATDGTLFGSYNEDSGSEAQTFTIANSGDGLLTLGSDAVSVSGTNAADFTVTSQPATTVAASGGSTTFEITFDPSGTGSRTATVSIANDDLDEAPFTFDVEGEGLDITPPAAFSVAFDDSTINAAEAGSTSFTFTGAEVGASYDFSISSSGGGSAVTGSGTVASAGEQISGIDVSGLGDGTLTLSVTLEDASSNSAGPETDTATLDQTAPTVTISGPSATQTGAFTATFTFSEDVTGFALADISVGNGSASAFAGSGDSYTATITPAADGSVTVDVAADAATDDAGNGSTAATQFSVEADITAPTLAITGPSLTQTGAFTATFTFSESVTGFALADISVGNGSASALAGSGDTYTATITPAADGTVTIDVAADAATDDAGNGNTAATQFSVDADVTAPGVTISGPSSVQNGAFSVTFTFSEDVTGFTVADVSVTNASLSAFSGSGDTYSVTVTPASDGSVAVDVLADVTADAAGNGNTAATQFSVEADLTAPTVGIFGPSGAQTGAFVVTISFSEDVTGFALADISVGNGSASGLSGSGGDYTATITPSASGTVTVDIGADGANDEAGNGNTAATQFSVEADLDPPSVSISGPSASQTGVFSVTFTFSEDVTGFALADISVGNGSASSFAGSGDTYTADITPAADGSVTVDVAADVATDDAGNGNTAATQFSVDADITLPTLAITGPSAAQTGAFTATFTFSEDVTGFDLADISVGNGVASGFAGSGDSYTATITPSADGTVTVDVAADAATDDAGNGNQAASQFTLEADITAPTVTITGPSATQTGAFTATFTFSEDVTGFALADISTGNATASGLAGSGDTYTATITPAADGAVTVDLAADSASDDAGNGNTVATQFSVEADITSPSVTVTGPSTTQAGAFTATFTFSEVVTGFALADITVGNGAASAFAGSGDTYTATITPAADGSVTVNVAADVATDDAGNGTSAASQFSVNADLTAPSLTISGPSAAQTGAFTATFTFSEAVTGFALADISVGNASVSSLSGSGDTYTATVTPAADGAVTIDVPSNVVVDTAGNGNAAASQYTVEADITAPGVAINGPSGTQTGAFTATFTFSEDVTGFALADISVGNGVASGLSGTGDAYTATITPTADGTVTVDVAADSASDDAGNGNTAATQFSVEADVTAPSLTITGPSAAQIAAFTATFTFSEDVTGFALADISVNNGAASAFAGSGDTYTATITPSGDGSVTLDVAADAATDDAGNGNTAASQFSVDADITTPALVISGPSDIQTGAFTASFTFSEEVTGFALADISVGNGAASDLAGSGDSYTATITPSADGSVTVDVAADAASDDAGNGNTAADQFSVEADISLPTADSLVMSDTDLRLEDVGGNLTITVGFSEAMDPDEAPEFAFDPGISDTLSFVSGVFSDGDTVYTATFSISDEGASVADVDVTVSGAMDAAGNTSPDATFADVFSIEMRRGSIEVVETIDGAIDGSFAFTGDLGAFTVDTSSQTGSEFFDDLVEGTYAFAVSATDGFTLQDIVCTGGTTTVDVAAGSVSVTLTPSDAVSCDFQTLADPDIDETTIPEVTIELPVETDDPTTETVSFSLDNVGGEAFFFTASTDVDWLTIDPTSGAIPAEGSLEFTIEFTDAVLDLDPGTYTATITITETASGSSNKDYAGAETLTTLAIPVTVTLEPREGNLTIVATTAPMEAGEGQFNYASTLDGLNGLSLSTSGGTASSSTLTIERGSYELTQLASEGWDLASISCSGDTDGGSVVDLDNGMVTIDLDAEEEIVCTFANRRNEDFIRGITLSAIRSFMAARADLILTNGPDVSTRMRGDRAGATPTRFAADFRDGRFTADLSTSLSAIRQATEANNPQAPGHQQFSLAGQSGLTSVDVWMQASFSSINDNRAGLNSDTDFGLYYLGVDAMASENILVGVLVQFDHAATTTGEWRSRVEGDGWMVGPYMVARLNEMAYLDVRAAWGQSDNTVNPIGLYTDAFETTRFLFESHLTGDLTRGNWRLSPEIGLAYFSETQDAYTDTLGIYIPSQDLTIGRLNVGPEIAYRFNGADGSYVEPYVHLNVVYDYDDADVFNLSGQLQSLGFMRGDARLGVNAQLGNGGLISGEISILGLGEGEFEANSAMIRVRLPLSLQ
ncbi:Ig-like domain-containing protein [Maricaulis parjimensis]|uniref:Ig-like domain-containing protein n=1 Tax=Maricaulis parjimensis TaxID=144023 RepID=UPI00193A6BB2|nr:Ig-like domain-containing protein [Maricaulis parjimensis]